MRRGRWLKENTETDAKDANGFPIAVLKEAVFSASKQEWREDVLPAKDASDMRK